MHGLPASLVIHSQCKVLPVCLSAPNTKTRPCKILQFFTAIKKIIFGWKIGMFFLIFAQNIDCGYTLKVPTIYVLGQNKKNVYPFKP